MNNDQKYVALMAKYKENRGKDPKGSLKYLDAAMALAKKVEISEDAILGGAYL
jgi:hypothetical protein